MLATRSRRPEHFESELSVWDWREKKELHSIRLPQWVHSGSIIRKDELLAITIGGPNGERDRLNDGDPHEVRLYTFPDLKEAGRFACNSYIHSSAISRDGALVATATVGNPEKKAKSEVCIWDVKTKKRMSTIQDFDFRTVKLAFSPDGETMAVVDFVSSGDAGPFRSSGVFIRQYQSKTGEAEKTLWLKRSTRPSTFEFLPDGKRMLVDCESVSIMDRQSGQELELPLAVFPHNQGRSVTLTTDGKWLVAGIERKPFNPDRPPQVVIFDLADNRVLKEWQAKTRWGIAGIAISPNKKIQAVGGQSVTLFDISLK